MEYVESLSRLRRIREITIEAVAAEIENEAREFARVSDRLREAISEFHDGQRTYRISTWWQLDTALPKDYSTAVAEYGPYLSYCEQAGGRIKKKRVSDTSEVKRVLGAEMSALISRYKRLGTKLGGITELLNLHCTLERGELPKGKVREAFNAEARERMSGASQAVRNLASSLMKLDEMCDEAIFDFNAIEGKRKRYGSFLSRWETPSRLPGKTFAGPTGPSVFYISFTRGKRLSAPIRNLYLKVHQRSPRGEVPLTKQMVQKSRLGKHMHAYRDAYKAILNLRHERNEIIDTLKAIQKRLA